MIPDDDNANENSYRPVSPRLSTNAPLITVPPRRDDSHRGHYVLALHGGQDITMPESSPCSERRRDSVRRPRTESSAGTGIIRAHEARALGIHHQHTLGRLEHYCPRRAHGV